MFAQEIVPSEETRLDRLNEFLKTNLRYITVVRVTEKLKRPILQSSKS